MKATWQGPNAVSVPLDAPAVCTAAHIAVGGPTSVPEPGIGGWRPPSAMGEGSDGFSGALQAFLRMTASSTAQRRSRDDSPAARRREHPQAAASRRDCSKGPKDGRAQRCFDLQLPLVATPVGLAGSPTL